jgi:lauroyl/myristoyl acyltransferase
VLEVVAGVTLIALAVALPLALLAACAVLLARLFTRRRRERALELA